MLASAWGENEMYLGVTAALTRNLQISLANRLACETREEKEQQLPPPFFPAKKNNNNINHNSRIISSVVR